MKKKNKKILSVIVTIIFFISIFRYRDYDIFKYTVKLPNTTEYISKANKYKKKNR